MVTVKDIFFSVIVIAANSFSNGNGYPPRFEHVPQTVTANEDAPNGKLLTSFNVVFDATNPGGTVSCANSDTCNLVSVNYTGPTSGSTYAVKVYKDGLYDRDYAPAQRNLYFTARDAAGITAEKGILLLINDVNDNAPTFHKLPYQTSIEENAKNGTSLNVNIYATDPDNGAGGSVSYSMKAAGQTKELSEGVFIINRVTGKVTVHGAVDYETLTFFQYNVSAYDGDNKTTYTDLIIKVIDQQDQPPIFQRLPYLKTIKETSKVDQLVLTVTAQDGDRGIPRNIQYRLENGTCGNFFSINGTTGEMKVSKALDRDEGPIKDVGGVCVLNVTAVEINHNTSIEGQKSNETETTTSVTITVEDVNDNKPSFAESIYNATILEELTDIPLTIVNNPSGIHVEDKDQGVNSEFEVLVYKADNMNTPFSNISSIPALIYSNGNILLRLINPFKFDYETQKSVDLVLVAKETKTEEQRSNNCTIHVKITDANDNYPIFQYTMNKTQYDANIPENSKNMTNIINITATDKDSGSFGQITYKFIGNQEKFYIDSSSGQVFTNCDNSSLDRETQSIYFLTVEAQDGGGKRTPTLLTVTLDDTNDNSPTFIGNNYNFVVEENSINFTNEVKVSATDKDEGNNSRIGYIIDFNSTDFKRTILINETTGVVYLNNTIDRESIQSEDINIPIVAFDHGFPPKSSTVTATLSVRDENDNSPEFMNSSYTGNIQENSPEGKTVVAVSAQDYDSTSPNKDFTYFIQSGSSEQFTIDGRTGIISVQVGARLDRESQDWYNLTVITIDKGTPERNSTTEVYIQVLDVNDDPPRFTQSAYSKDIVEDKTVNSSVIVCNATDKDTNHSLIYEMHLVKVYNNEGQDKNTTAFTNWFGIQKTTGEVYIKKAVDAEEATRLQFILNVTDTFAVANNPQTATASLTINIKDVNDETPTFEPDQYSANLSEAAVKDTNVITVSAIDKDIMSIHKDVSYHIERNYNDAFSIGEKTGTVSLVKSGIIDREKEESISIKIMATDGLNNSTALINITLIDANDNTPQFSQRTYLFNISEMNYTHCKLVGSVNSTDDDIGNNARVTYTITNVMGFFNINETTGEIYVCGDVDREKNSKFVLQVTAQDNPSVVADIRKNTTTVTITVSDENDNKPKFTQIKYEKTIVETVQINHTVVSVSADDPDDGLNGEVKYELGSGGNNTNQFWIDGNIIKTNVSLADDINMYTVEVIAYDLGEPRMSSSAFVYVTIEDYNNNDPVFNKDQSLRNTVFECADIDTTVFTILATDADMGNNAKLTYQFNLANGSKTPNFENFKIDNATGTISVLKKLDREQKSKYEFTVFINDNGIPKRSVTSPTLTIEVLDVNDNPPEFPQATQRVSVKENVADIEVTKVIAYDNDTNHKIVYAIEAANPSFLRYNFKICESAGIVSLTNPLDRENTTSGNLTIKATDATQTQNLTSQCQNTPVQNQANQTTMVLIIIVLDENDNPPEFSSNLIRSSILRNSKFGSLIVDLKEKVEPDPDSPEHSIHKFVLLSIKANTELQKHLQDVKVTTKCPDGNLTMICVNSNGTVITNMVFSESSKGYFELSVRVSDAAGNDTTKLKIHIIGDTQLVYMNVKGDKSTVHKDKEKMFEELDSVFHPKYDFVFDSYEPSKNADGSINEFWTMVVFHVVEIIPDIVLEANDVVRLMDKHVIELEKVKQQFRVYEIQAYTGRPQASSGTKIKETYVLIAVITLLGLILCIIIFFYINSTNKYKRKLKAATVTVTDVQDEKHYESLYFPGSNVFSSTKNPLLNKDEEMKKVSVVKEDTDEAGSENHFDINDDDFEKKTGGDDPLEEREVVMEMYGEDTFRPDDKLNALQYALEEHEKQQIGNQKGHLMNGNVSSLHGTDNLSYHSLETTEV